MPGRPAGQRGGVAAGRDPLAGGLGHGHPDRRLADEPVEQADRVRAAADAGQDEVRQPALDRPELRGGLVAEDPLEVAHDRRVGVRAHRRAEDVVGRLDVRDPVAHRLVDRVLEGRRAARDRPDLGAEGAHPEDVRRLAADVLGAHEHDARQVEQGAGGRGRHAVLAGPGLGDHPRLAEPAGEERLAEGVVDLVGAGVGEVLALEVETEGRGQPSGRGRPRGRERAGGRQGLGGQAVGPVERGRPPGVRRQALAELGPEARVVADPGVGALETLERGHQRLGHVAAAELAVDPPAAGRVRLEETGMDRRRAGRDVGPVDPGRAGPLGEQRDAERVLARALAGCSRRLDARGDVDADGRDLEDGRGRRWPGRARRRARPAARGRRRRPAAPAARVPVPPGIRAAGRVEQEPLGPGGEERPPAVRDRRRGRGHEVVRRGGRQVERPSRPLGRARPRAPAARSPLSWIASGSTAATISASRAAPASAVTATIAAGRAAGGDRPGESGQLGRLVELERPGRARHEVEPDRVGAGPDRGLDAVRVGHPADLHEREPVGDRGVVREGAGRDERARGRGRVGRPHQRLADEGGVEADRPPAGDRRRARGPRTRRPRSDRRGRGRAAGRPAPGSTSSVRRSRLLIPMTRARVASARRARGRRGPRRAARARGRARRRPAPASRRAGWRTASSRTASAPAARRSGSWRGSTTNSLARTGRLTAARTAARSAIEPPNQCGSQRTEIALAPPRS